MPARHAVCPRYTYPKGSIAMTNCASFRTDRSAKAMTVPLAAVAVVVVLLLSGLRPVDARAQVRETPVGPLASQEVPDSIVTTAPGRVFAAWLDAFNSGDPARAEGFDSAYHADGRPMSAMGSFRRRTGGFTLLRVEELTADRITALIQERNSDTVGRLTMSVSVGDAPKMTDLSVRAVARPSELQIERLTEAEALEALRRRARELAEEGLWSGALVVARDGRIRLAEAAGMADRASGTPVALETRFRIGSMNKMFTAVATLQLVEAGRLALDDPVGDVLRDYPNDEVASRVTIRHLLTHTGGTGDIFGPEFRRNRTSLREHTDYLQLYGQRGLAHEPGAEQQYSNYGFVLLGAIIEEVSDVSYYEYVRRRIFLPAGMTSTGSQPESEDVPRRSVGYTWQDGAWVSNASLLPWRGTAAGGGYSTVEDLLRFIEALESGVLLPDRLYAEMTQPQENGYGYGFVTRADGTLRSYGHGGGFPGMNGALRVYPELGYTIVALSNLDPPAASRLVDYFTNRMPIGERTHDE